VLAREAEALASAKKIALFAAGVASQRFMTGLQEQQEVMADLAAIIMQVYALESALLRRGNWPFQAMAPRRLLRV